ncbi:MAG TPA: OmpA family protein [Thermoanaerobaculia bacterium]|nr:OmpA family protein [Thermoanaerobaculia bacterium]
MKAKRTALLGMLACLIGAVASAQIAPDNGGDIGLFTMPTADQPQPGTFTLGAYGWLQQLAAGNLPDQNIPDRNRVYQQASFEGSVGYGFTRGWSIFASAGADQFKSRGGWQGGAIAGIPFPTPFTSNEGRKLRLGTKVTFFSDESDLRVGLWLTSHIPVTSSTQITTSTGTFDGSVNSPRTDWEWGAVVTKGIFNGMVQYVLSGRQDNDVRPSNLLRFGFGVDAPIAATGLHVIGEIDYTVNDGGDLPPPNYSQLNAGIRYWIGRSGWAISSAFSANLNLLFSHGNNPAPWGGILGVTYAAFPPLPPPPVVVPPPAPAPPPEAKIETQAPAPPAAPAPAPPPPPTPKKTTDEIYFDAGSARLTNIAKAMLDGIALRMKNDLNSTAAITGYSDNTGKEETNMDISAKRAQAAKEYLVTRHGIDPNRVAVFARGSQEAAYDNATPEGRAKNRRAVIVVTVFSGP